MKLIIAGNSLPWFSTTTPDGGKTLPKNYGYSYSDFFRDYCIFYPIPINYIVRYWRRCYWGFLRFFYWLGLIDRGVAEEFRWADFFRIKVH